MHLYFTRIATTFLAGITLLFFVALAHCVDDAGGAILVDGGTTVEEGGTIYVDGGAAIYHVSGTASGVPTGQNVTLTLNGGTPIMVVNGTFSFPGAFALGQTYVIAIAQMPAAYTCALANASGTISGDVKNVALTCAATDATLSALTASAVTIGPAFSPATLAYSAQKRISGVLPPAETTTVTATATDPNAKIVINGIAATSGTPTAPITLKSGVNAIAVTVTAADGKDTTQYAIAITCSVNDFIRAAHPNGNQFGTTIALSSDGNTLAVGAPNDASSATGINGNEQDVNGQASGAVFVFRKTGGTWAQEAYVKPAFVPPCAPMAACNFQTEFGTSVSLSADGNTLAVGGPFEASKASGINGDPTDLDVGIGGASGATWVFSRAGTTWTQQAYIKALNAHYAGFFGNSVSLSSDGNTLAIGEYGNRSAVKGVLTSDPADALTEEAGAAYVYTRSGTTWSFQAMFKASNTVAYGDFGHVVALSSSDGNTLAVGSTGELSAASGVGANQNDTSAAGAGATYVFTRSGVTWSQQIYIKASNARAGAYFGSAMAISSDGNTLGVGSYAESSNARGVNGTQSDTSAMSAGAAYVFLRTGTTWAQQAYLKASNTPTSCSNMGIPPCEPQFGAAIALSADGNFLVAGAPYEASNALGINGDQKNTAAFGSGASYSFTRAGTTWSAGVYIKASNQSGTFGSAISCSTDCTTLAVSAPQDGYGAAGVNGNQMASTGGSGALYVF